MFPTTTVSVRGDVTSRLTDMVKGAYYLPGTEFPEYERPALASLVADAKEAFDEARKSASQDIEKSIMPGFRPLLGLGGAQVELQQQVADLRKMVAELTKTEITQSYPISGSQTGFGFAIYSMEAPSKKTFPVMSPWRNRFPRDLIAGSAIHWKEISAITGSGGSVGNVNHFIGELPSNSVGGIVLNLPPEIQFAGADHSATFQPIGLSGSNSMVSQWVGKSFEDIRELVDLSTLQALMLMEERGISSARNVAVAAPTISSAVAGAASGSQVGISGATTNVYVQVTALTKMGESLASAISTVAVANGQVVTVTIGTPTGAEAYRVYVGTGAADPGTAAHFKAGDTGYNVFVIQGALPTSGPTPPAADSTASANAYNGVLAQLEQGSNPYVKALNGLLTLAAVQTALQDRFDQVKADIEEIWASAGDRRSLSDLVLAQSGAAAQGFRINITPGDSGITAGVIVSAFLNESTGREVPVRVDPWLHTGNLIGLSYTLPFPNSQIPNVWAILGPQDYLAINWPVIDLNYRTSVVAMNAVVGYAPNFNFWLRGIQNANPTVSSQ